MGGEPGRGHPCGTCVGADARRGHEGGRRQRAGAAGVRVGWDLGAEVDLGSKMSGFRVSGDYMVGWTAGIGVLGLLARDLGGEAEFS